MPAEFLIRTKEPPEPEVVSGFRRFALCPPSSVETESLQIVGSVFLPFDVSDSCQFLVHAQHVLGKRGEPFQTTGSSSYRQQMS